MKPIHTIRFKSALVGNQWHDQVTFTLQDGLVSEINFGHATPVDLTLDLVALPGMINLHSHAFQRGFAGLSEYKTSEHDSFWTWRNLMYQFVNRLTPDDVLAIAQHLYLEMLSAGYTWVGEFHYLHNADNGMPYANLGEMSDAILQAANHAGIGLCHLPVLYQRGGFQNESLAQGQKRFELNNERFVELVEAFDSKSALHANVVSGIALHSLRAVESNQGLQVISHLKASRSERPIHIHVAEQVQEVADCLATHQRRPVEYLFDQYEVDSNWCLIHATHLNENEIERIAESTAVVGLCPTTEANLGDGFFPAKEFLAMNGRIGIGSDSHCSVDLRDELRTLEYGQRLQSKSRAILGTTDQSVGSALYQASAAGGAQAIGIDAGTIQVGSRADFTLVDPNHPAIALAENDRLLDRMIFTNSGNPIAGTVIGGQLTLTNSQEFQAKFADSAAQFNQVCKKIVSS